MKGLISFVFEMALLVGIGTVGFNQMYKETKITALKKVGEGTVSLTKLNEKLTGRPNWVDTPTPKNILKGIGVRK